MNSTHPVSIKNRRTMKEIQESCKKLLPAATILADNGDGVAMLFLSYLRRAVRKEAVGDHLLNWSYPNWDMKSVPYADGAFFEIHSRASDFKGVFLSVRRVVSGNMPPASPDRGTDILHLFFETLRDGDKFNSQRAVSQNFWFVVGDIIRTVKDMNDYCVGFRQDKGIYLTFLEAKGTDQYLEIYFGHWLDETLYPYTTSA